MRSPGARKLYRLVEQKDWRGIRDYSKKKRIPDLADILLQLPDAQSVLAFKAMPRAISDELFAHLDAEQQEVLLARMTRDETKHLLDSLSHDDRTHLLEEMPADIAKRLLRLLSPADRAEARMLLGYPEESVGRLMTLEYLAVRPKWTLEHALEHIRRKGHDLETLNTIFVVDSDGKLLDELKLRSIILGDPEHRVSSIMDDHFVSLSPHDDREKAVHAIKKYDLFVVPVIDSRGVLLGIVTADDVLDVAEEETTEDIHKAGSVVPLGTSYRRANAFVLYRRRIGWLSALILVSLLSSGVIAAFEGVLSSTIALVFFIPLLMATAGNTGSQSATLLVRAIATDEVKLWEWGRVFSKEVLVGVLLGATLAVLTYFVGVFRADYRIGLIVGLTMMAIVLMVNLLGATLPFLLSRFNIDPAVASAPLITVIADALGLFIYFSIATALLM